MSKADKYRDLSIGSEEDLQKKTTAEMLGSGKKTLDQVSVPNISTSQIGISNRPTVSGSYRLNPDLVDSVNLLVDYEKFIEINRKSSVNQVIALALKEYLEKPENQSKIKKMRNMPR